MKNSEGKHVKPVIKELKATRSDIGVRSLLTKKRQVKAFTIVKIDYEDRKRTPFDGMVKGMFLGAGDDFFVMLDEDIYKLYDDSAAEIGSVPLSTGKFSGCQPYGFWLMRDDETMSVFDKTGQEIGTVPSEFLKRPKKRTHEMITKFWLSSPNPMTGMFWIRYKKAGQKFLQHPVFISIQSLFRLFKNEGVDPLATEEDPNEGYYFKNAAVQHLGPFLIETTDEAGNVVCITVAGVAPIDEQA
jgi:hypothetical protein